MSPASVRWMQCKVDAGRKQGDIPIEGFKRGVLISEISRVTIEKKKTVLRSLIKRRKNALWSTEDKNLFLK